MEDDKKDFDIDCLDDACESDTRCVAYEPDVEFTPSEPDIVGRSCPSSSIDLLPMSLKQLFMLEYESILAGYDGDERKTMMFLLDQYGHPRA